MRSSLMTLTRAGVHNSKLRVKVICAQSTTAATNVSLPLALCAEYGNLGSRQSFRRCAPIDRFGWSNVLKSIHHSEKVEVPACRE